MEFDGPSVQFSSVQSLSRVRLFVTPWIVAQQASLYITNSRRSLRLTSIESVMPSSHLILCRPLFLLSAISPSIRVFFNESTLCMRWPKYWSFSFIRFHQKRKRGRKVFQQRECVPGMCTYLSQAQDQLKLMIRKLLFFSCVWLFATPCTAACQSPLSFTISQSLLKIMFIESMLSFNHLLQCHPLLLLPSIFPSVRVISNEPAFHIRRPKYWSFSFSIHPSNEYSGLISSRTDWSDLLAVQHGSSKTKYCLYFYYSWP